jgi:NTP pyrophosphatase (non-canonical NTP hydrolase)
LGVVEEIGELAHVVLKQDQKIIQKIVDPRVEEIDAIGNIVIFLINFCNFRGYDFETCVSTTAGEVLQRDWRKYPKNGVNQ